MSKTEANWAKLNQLELRQTELIQGMVSFYEEAYKFVCFDWEQILANIFSELLFQDLKIIALEYHHIPFSRNSGTTNFDVVAIIKFACGRKSSGSSAAAVSTPTCPKFVQSNQPRPSISTLGTLPNGVRFCSQGELREERTKPETQFIQWFHLIGIRPLKSNFWTERMECK